MSVEYFYENDLNMLYNAAVNNNPDGGEHHTKMLESYNNLVAYISHIEHWKSTALQLAKNYGVRIHSLEQHIAELESVNEDQALTISQTDYAYTIDKEMMEMMEKRIAELETYIDDFDEDFERLKDEVKESNGLLRSAFMIAKRDGKETNWEAWRKQLEIALERQHAMMYPNGEK